MGLEVVGKVSVVSGSCRCGWRVISFVFCGMSGGKAVELLEIGGDEGVAGDVGDFDALGVSCGVAGEDVVEVLSAGKGNLGFCNLSGLEPPDFPTTS